MQIGIRNQVGSTSTLELHFLDTVSDRWEGDWWDGEYVNVVEEVINKVKEAKPSHIHLVIDSEGGDARKGIAIHNFIKNYDATVSSEILGLCGSIATVIAMAADKGNCKIPKNSFYVIHEAWGWGMGRAGDLRAQADVIEQHTDVILNIYNERTGISIDDLRAMIKDGDYWMTGKQAVEKGFCDGHVENEVGEFAIAARICNLNEHYRNIPRDLLAITDAIDIDNTDNNTLINSLMNYKEKIVAFINTLKGKKVENKTDNLGEDISALLNEPMQKLGEDLQAETKAELDTREENFKKEVTNKLEARLEALEKGEHEVIKNQATTIQKLQDEIAELTGGEYKPKNETTSPKVIGTFSED